MHTDLKYLQSNQYTKLPMYVAFHSHTTYELIYFHSGEGIVNCNDSAFLYSSGSIIIIPPQTTHDEMHYSATDVTFISFTLDDKELIQKPFVYSQNDENIRKQVLELCKEYQLSEAFSKEKCNALLLLLVIGALRGREAEVKKDKKRNRMMKEPEEPIIRMHIDKSYNEIGYSYDRYRHIFKTKMGISPHQFIIKSRIHKAEYLLKYTTLPITEICLMCGFSSSPYFSKQFKKHNGMSPREYRKIESNSTQEE